MNNTADAMTMDLFALRNAYLAESLTPSDIIETVLKRIERCRGYNAWISVRSREDLLAEALRLRRLDPAGLPLYGIPFAVKDNIDVAGLSTTAACPAFGYRPARSAFAVQALANAGAIVIGKTNLDQFATGLTGTRVPEMYGVCKNALNPDYISGGSSSGSAVAVALDQVGFSLGTDTAGSGRIPAAFNGIVGFKPSRGLISCAGVVPACKSLDCVSIFTRSAEAADYVFDLLNVADSGDAYARESRDLLDADACVFAGAGPRVGVPRPDQLEFFGDGEGARLFASAVERLESLGAAVETVDFSPFLEAASLLYEGPWIAERYAGIQHFIKANPEALHPVTAGILGAARGKSAVQAFQAFHRLAELKRQTHKLLATLTCMAVPTAGRIYRIAEVLADPVATNTRLGYYTNYMNLLDLCALAIPAGSYAAGLPFGITLFAAPLADRRLLALAQRYMAPDGDTGALADRPPSPRYIRIAVCGAHMRGLPLNGQLTELGARFCAFARTSASYRLYALPLAPPERPGLVRDPAGGAPIELELWEMPVARLADFVRKIPDPLCLGSVELNDGRWEYGFLCQQHGIAQAQDITPFGGWRRYLADRQGRAAEA